MNSEWQSFLNEKGALIEDGMVQPFTSDRQDARAITEQTAFTPLSHLGLIRVGGDDAANFLQNQLTNDLREVSDNRSQFTAWCSPKGRVLACFRLFQMEGSLYLQLPRTLLPATMERLKKYVLISKVTLEDVSDRYEAVGVAGPEAETLILDQFPAAPSRIDEVVSEKGCTLLRIPGTVPRIIVTGDTRRLMELWCAAETSAQPVGTAAWRLLDIQAGLPSIHPETVEAFVPQMINLDVIGGISFDKGCYPGQEVVARVRYLGKLKRRMYRARLDSMAMPSPGNPLILANEGRETGKVVDAQPAAGGGYELLAVLEITTVENGEPIALQAAPETRLELLRLPYSIR